MPRGWGDPLRRRGRSSPPNARYARSRGRSPRTSRSRCPRTRRPAPDAVAPKRSGGHKGSLVKRSPSTLQPSSVRSRTRVRSSSDRCSASRWAAETGSGRDGWLSTGAITVASTIRVRAKFPVRHMPNRTHARPPALGVRRAAQCPEPIGDGARGAAREHREFAADAGAQQLTGGIGTRQRLLGRPEQMGQVDGEAGIRDPGGETLDLGRDPGNLVHDDDRSSRPAAIHRSRRTGVGEGKGVVGGERHRPSVPRRLGEHNRGKSE